MKTTVWLAAATVGLAGCATLEIQGHRGARGLAPENTLVAFNKGLDAGVDTLELDVGVTKDGWVVVSHDQALNPDITRGPDGKYLEGKAGPAIKDLTIGELRQYDVGRINPGTEYAKRYPDQQSVDGTRIPTLVDLMQLVRDRGHRGVTLNIEIKRDPTKPELTPPVRTYVGALVTTLYTYSFQERVTIQSFDWEALEVAKALAPGIPRSYLTAQRKTFDTIEAAKGSSAWTGEYKYADYGSVPKMVKAAGGLIWSPNYNDLDEAKVKEAKALNLVVMPWTVNDPEAAKKLKAWGVDGVITDRPDVIRASMK